MGVRQSLGLFVSPINPSTGLGIVIVSFAMAVAQLASRAAQPLFGMLADRVGSCRVIVIGELLLALGLPLREKRGAVAAHAGGITLGAQTALAFGDRSDLCPHARSFTCGFPIAFLVTHLPGEVGLCGQPASVAAASIAIVGVANIAGSIGAGWLGQTRRMKTILFWMYASRALAVAV